MSELKRVMSPEALARAVRAKLVMTHGATSPYVVLPLAIHEVSPDENGVNWKLVVDADDQPLEGADAMIEAALKVAESFNLGSLRH